MGTEKRERQKANRQLRRIEEAKAARVSAVKRNVIRWSIVFVLALAGIVTVAAIGGAFSGDDDPETPEITIPVVTLPAEDAPTTSAP